MLRQKNYLWSLLYIIFIKVKFCSVGKTKTAYYIMNYDKAVSLRNSTQLFFITTNNIRITQK